MAAQNEELRRFVHSALASDVASKAIYEQLVSSVGTLIAETQQEPLSLQNAQGASASRTAAANHLCILLHSLASFVAMLDENAHTDLLRTLYNINLWLTPYAVTHVWLDLLQHLVSVRAVFLQPTVNHLVKAFMPSGPAAAAATAAAIATAPTAVGAAYTPLPAAAPVHAAVVDTLGHIMRMKPLARATVRDAVAACAPHRLAPAPAMHSYFEALFQLAESRYGEAIRDSLLGIAISKIVELDCEIKWEDIVEQLMGQEDEEGSTDGEDEDLILGGMEEHVEELHISPRAGTEHARAVGAAAIRRADSSGCIGFEGRKQSKDAAAAAAAAAPPPADSAAARSISMVAKLDPVLDMTFAHMSRRAASSNNCGTEDGAAGRRTLWAVVMDAFDRVVLLSERVKFSPYIVFHAATLCGAAAGERFVDELVSRVIEPAQPTHVRTACAAYAASFLARYAPLDPAHFNTAVVRLTDFCHNYARRATVTPAPSTALFKRVRTRTSVQSCASSTTTASLSANGIHSQYQQPAHLHKAPSVPPLQTHNGFDAAYHARVTTPCLSASSNGLFSDRRTSAATAGPNPGPAAPLDWERHEVFYAACQAIMYPLCYTMQTARATHSCSAAAKALMTLVRDRVVPLMRTDMLAPLVVCLPSVCAEFARQVSALGVRDLDELAAAAADAPRLRRHFEMFFPFDPFLLPLSKRALALGTSYRSWRHGHVVGTGPQGADVDDDDVADDANDDEDDEDEDDSDESSADDDDLSERLGASPGVSLGSSPQAGFVGANPFAAARGAVAGPMPVATKGIAVGARGVGAVGRGSTASDPYLVGHSYGSSPPGSYNYVSGLSPDGAAPMSISETPGGAYLATAVHAFKGA